ncbi:hypothetical protein J2T60_002347 [Natronospira proteinivora]|uniref:ATP-grasp domain-containing protein n=1 Tax=Natronospira proteinivora TaxID=1807133 RepID=A0ABT1GEH0_9GAMM|nr:ATP-grasp domain-containing protein [Natronospira proteinivora]MCP1728347.1 hypothetical protein [Natronospira proteinivora]
MFLVDEPYVSDFLKQTLHDYSLPVVDTPVARELALTPGTPMISEAQAAAMMAESDTPSVCTTSENAFAWIARQSGFSDLSRKVDCFKNKAAFRRLTQPLLPDFAFAEIRTDDLAAFPIETMPLPCIIKPTVGFFSLGVHKVASVAQWPDTVGKILSEIEHIHHLYPTEVVNLESFLLEECIEGEEFAVDAYFNEQGEPVILGIWQHRFSSDEDVGDRVYSTSKALMETHLQDFEAFVGEIGRLAGIRDFPLHIELRRTPDGALRSIEVNPLRFGGWCTTADGTYKAYGLNPYVAYHNQQRPNWDALLKDQDGKVYSLVVLDNLSGIRGKDIAAFDYEKLLDLFDKPLELRKVDFRQFPVFGFLFVETTDWYAHELETILHSSLREFIQRR